MWYYFKKKSEKNGIFVYDYGYQSKEMTGEVRFNKLTNETNVIKLAKNDDGKIQIPPVYSVVVRHNAPYEQMIAYG
jgi:hypothetical protein